MTDFPTSPDTARLTDSTCYVERSMVRIGVMGTGDEALLKYVDALPIFTASDFCGLAQRPDYVRGLEDAALIVERWSLPTIQTPSMWLVDKAGIAADIRALADTSTILKSEEGGAA